MGKNRTPVYALDLWIDRIKGREIGSRKRNGEPWWDPREAYWRHGPCSLLGAKHKQQVVGVTAFRIADDIADILAIDVDPAVRRLRVGSKMLTRLAMSDLYKPPVKPFTCMRMRISLHDEIAKLFLESSDFHCVDIDDNDHGEAIAVMMKKIA